MASHSAQADEPARSDQHHNLLIPPSVLARYIVTETAIQGQSAGPKLPVTGLSSTAYSMNPDQGRCARRTGTEVDRPTAESRTSWPMYGPLFLTWILADGAFGLQLPGPVSRMSVAPPKPERHRTRLGLHGLNFHFVSSHHRIHQPDAGGRSPEDRSLCGCLRARNDRPRRPHLHQKPPPVMRFVKMHATIAPPQP